MLDNKKIVIGIITHVLKQFKDVEWDRFIESKQAIHIYGWIPRAKDEYKDFIYLEFLNWSGVCNFWISSSPEITKKASKIVSNASLQLHNCKRVENHFDIQNSIKLVKQ